MKRVLQIVAVVVLISGTAGAQEAVVPELFDPAVFRAGVDVRSSLATIVRAMDNPREWEELMRRILFIDGVAASVIVHQDDEEGYYAEVELVTGSWHGVEHVELHRAWVVMTDPVFSGRLAERPPRQPDPDIIVRNDRVLVAARILDIFEDEDGTNVPVLEALELRAMR